MEMRNAILIFAILYKLVLREGNAQNIFVNGPVSVKLTRIVKCPNSDKMDVKFHVAMRKISRHTTGLDGNATVPYEIGGNIRATLETARWADGGWKHNVLTLPYSNACEAVNTLLGQTWYKIQREIKPPMVVGKCPIAKGVYVFKNLIFDWDDIEFKIPYIGRFFVTIKFFDMAKTVLCFQLELDIKKKN